MSTAAPDRLDDALSVGELIDAAGYTQRVRGAADYRLLQIISRIHAHREDQHIAEVAARAEQIAPREAVGIAEVLSPRDKYGPNGLELAIADVGAALCLTPQHAKKLVAIASAARYRVPETARTLADGIPDLDRLITAVTAPTSSANKTSAIWTGNWLERFTTAAHVHEALPHSDRQADPQARPRRRAPPGRTHQR